MAINIKHSEQYFLKDFTTKSYIDLLSMAKEKYKFTTYNRIDTNEKFILWRHDVDFSLNRSLKLAQIEYEAGIRSTFFLNPHSEFYNILEKSQSAIINNIMKLGHNIGLHFDASYYNITSENQLDSLISKEAEFMRSWFGEKIIVFSFHNPNNVSLGYDAETYGGLINCYSKFFKQNIPYCSDSNGYWRFRRLYDVLKEGRDKCLQVLTHPGWWQENIMIPRDRITRCINGRASALLKNYDNLLQSFDRKNIGLKSKD